MLRAPHPQAILSRYPECSICFLAAQDTSTTGFAVHFSMDGGGGNGAWARVCRAWPLNYGDTVLSALGVLMAADVARLVS